MQPVAERFVQRKKQHGLVSWNPKRVVEVGDGCLGKRRGVVRSGWVEGTDDEIETGKRVQGRRIMVKG